MPTEQEVNEIEIQKEEPGDSLRQAREAAGLTTKDVADSLNLLLTNIEAIEANRYENMNAGIFTRGYVKSYARFLGLDADALVAAADVRLKGASHNNGISHHSRGSKTRGEHSLLAELKPAHKVLAAILAAGVIWVGVSLILAASHSDDSAVSDSGPVAREGIAADSKVEAAENVEIATMAVDAEDLSAADAELEE